MYDEMSKKMYAQFEQNLKPFQSFATLAVDHAEKLTSFQLDAAKAYFDLGVEQTRSALHINDTKSFQDYVSKQQQVATTISRKVGDDVETLAGFGRDFSDAASKLARENVDSVQRTAAPKARKSA